MAGKLTHVSVQQGAGHNLLSPAEFVRLPVSERIELVLQHRAVFLDENGDEMPVGAALAQLKTLAPAPMVRKK